MGKQHPRTKEKTGRRVLRRLEMGLIVLAMLAVLLMQVSGRVNSYAAEETSPLAQRSGRVVMYAQDDVRLELRDEDADKMDQLNYAFALIENGEATGRHWQSIRQVSAYLRRHPEIDGVLSVGGWGAEGFSDACATAAGREKLADSMLSLMDAHGFVGVDVDWEYPGSSAAGITRRDEDVENWYQLLALLRQGLDARQEASGRDYLLSVALGAGEAQVKAVDGARLSALVDQAVVMAYDLRGFDRETGHHAGLYPDGETQLSGAWAVKAYAETGLTESKMLLGIPLYGRQWRRVPTANDGLFQRAETSGNKAITYDEALAMAQEDGVQFYDMDAQAAWLFDGSSFVSYENKESMAAKAKWVRDGGLLGAALWSYSQDGTGTQLETLSSGLCPDTLPGASPLDLT